LGLPNEFFVSTAQGLSNTSSGVSNPGVCLNTNNSVFNIESGVTFISFKNVTATNGNVTITGAAGGATITSVEFPKLEYTAGTISGVTNRVSAYNFSSLKAAEGNISLSGSANAGIDFSSLRRTKGLFIEYGTGGSISGLDSLRQFIACIPPNQITGISGINLNTYPYTKTGTVYITGDALSFTDTSLVILPSGTPNFITTSGTYTGDFLSGYKQGSVTFYSPNNATEIKLAQNYLNPVPTSAPAIFNYIATTGVTGITFPPVSGAAYYMVTANSGAASGAPLNIDVKTTGESGTLLGFTYQPRNIANTNRRVDITISGYSAISGNAANLITMPVNVSATRQSGAFCITANSASGVFVSGNNLTTFASTFVSGDTEFQASFVNRGTGPLVYTATGSNSVSYGNSRGILMLASGSNSTGTFNFLNSSQIAGGNGAIGQFELIAGGVRSSVTFNAPQAVLLNNTPISGGVTNTSGTVIFNAPLLRTTIVSGALRMNISGTAATGIFTLGNPNGMGGITCTGVSGGRVIFNATGGAAQSGNVASATFAAFGGFCDFNFGDAATIAGLTLTLTESGAITGTVTGATGSIGTLSVAGTTSGTATGVIVLSGIRSASISNHQIIGNGTNFTGIFNFTGGPAVSSALSSIFVASAISGANVIVDYPCLNNPATAWFLAYTGGVVSATVTGLNNAGGFFGITGVGDGARVFYTGGQISTITGNLPVVAQNGAGVNFNFTGGAPSTGGTVNSNVNLTVTNTSIGGLTFITGNLGNLNTIGGALNLIVDEPSYVIGTSLSLTATGLKHVAGVTTISGNGPAARIFYTGGQITGSVPSSFIYSVTGANVNFTYPTNTPITGSIAGITLISRTSSSITGNLGGLASGGNLSITSTGAGSSINLTATGLTNFSTTGVGFRITGQAGASIFYTGAVQTCPSISLLTSTSGGTGTINCIFTGVPSTGVVGTIAITGAWPETFITGTINTISTIQTGVSIVSSGRAILTATGITIISGSYPNGLVITGLTTSSVVSGIFPGLQTVSEDVRVTISGSGGVSFSGLQVVSGSYIVSGGASAGRVDHGLSGLASLTGIAVLQNEPQTIYLGPVDAVTGEVSLTGLKQIGNSGTIFNLVSGVVTTSGINNFDTRNLTGWYGRIDVSLPGATGFNLSSVQFLGSNSATGFAASQMNTPALQFVLGTGVTGNITLTGLQYLYHRDMHNAVTQGTATGFLLIASGATSVSMPNIITGSLRQISGATTKTGWIQGASITGLSFGSSGTTKELFMNFTASGCPLNQASVDNILQTFASLDGTSSTTVYSGLTIRLNGLCTAPSATGSGYRTTLTGAGRLNTVLVN
jgi:hypothetical protein